MLEANLHLHSLSFMQLFVSKITFGQTAVTTICIRVSSANPEFRAAIMCTPREPTLIVLLSILFFI